MKGIIQDVTLTNIANAIRQKGGATGRLLPSEMAAAINSIHTGPRIYIGELDSTDASGLGNATIEHNLWFVPSHMVIYGYFDSNEESFAGQSVLMFVHDPDVYEGSFYFKYGSFGISMTKEQYLIPTFTETTANIGEYLGILIPNHTYRVLIW